MRIEINGDIERLIQAGIASGEYRSAEEVIAAMARAWSAAKAEHGGAARRLTPSTDIRGLIVEQGVQPFDPTEQIPDFWPTDESAAEFLAFLRDVRHDDVAGKP